MINTRAANRYAKAFLSITKSEDDLMIMFKDMSSVKKAFEQSQELKPVSYTHLTLPTSREV